MVRGARDERWSPSCASAVRRAGRSQAGRQRNHQVSHSVRERRQAFLRRDDAGQPATDADLGEVPRRGDRADRRRVRRARCSDTNSRHQSQQP